MMRHKFDRESERRCGPILRQGLRTDKKGRSNHRIAPLLQEDILIRHAPLRDESKKYLSDSVPSGGPPPH
jgi:hypothetical protein